MKNRTIAVFTAILLLPLVLGIASPAPATPASEKEFSNSK